MRLLLCSKCTEPTFVIMFVKLKIYGLSLNKIRNWMTLETVASNASFRGKYLNDNFKMCEIILGAASDIHVPIP